MILESEVEPSRTWSLHPRRDADPAGLGERFEPRGDIDAVAEDVVVLDDDVAEVDADAEVDALVGGDIGVALGHPALHRDGAAHRIDHAGEFDQHAVAGRLDDPPAMVSDRGIDQLAAQCLQRSQRAFLVHPDQPRIARDIGGKDRGETALCTLFRYRRALHAAIITSLSRAIR